MAHCLLFAPQQLGATSLVEQLIQRAPKQRCWQFIIGTGPQLWEKAMKKLSLFTSLSAALVCAAVPGSFNWSGASLTLFAPLGLTGECIGANTAGRRTGAAVGAGAVGAAAGAAVGVPVPAPEQDVGVPPPVAEQGDIGAPPPDIQPPPQGPAIPPYGWPAPPAELEGAIRRQEGVFHGDRGSRH